MPRAKGTKVAKPKGAKPKGAKPKDYLNEFPHSIKAGESRINGVVDFGVFWERQYKRQCIVKNEMETQIGILKERLSFYQVDAQRIATDSSNENEVPNGLYPGPSDSRVVQTLDNPSEKRKISEVDTIPDDNNWMGTDVLSLEYSQNHISEDRRFLQLNPTPAKCRELLELSWKALSYYIARYTDSKGAKYHSKETKYLMFLANKIIESIKTCVEISVEQYGTIAGREFLIETILTYSLCSFFNEGLTELQNLCVGSDEVTMIGFITKLLIGILRSIDWRSNNGLHKQIFEEILIYITYKVLDTRSQYSNDNMKI
ncbi:predicted protein [Sclerotinia sclerotiorum 1980 UF-70]|uniref:Uncharacterized protein n=1 Tax=Sclerotinia sclerotiorum (strain ATCC 18683 / 1980 / Ss-1) TaxID=665079 RepID=A7EDU8_SCLS1|nr:predicted protein [Sclerotinia sclerotiorum 1980 UF-70]EDO01014.1 predicted protein [Sclerotinia sclerotiorum 1980 UF-70]